MVLVSHKVYFENLLHRHPCITDPCKSAPHKENLRGDGPHTQKFAWGRPHAFPTQNISFFSSPQKNLHLLPAIPMNPHISTYIPMHLFCMGMCENLQFKSNICCPHTKFHHLVVPTQTAVIGTRPHAKFLPSVGLWDRGVHNFPRNFAKAAIFSFHMLWLEDASYYILHTTYH